MNYTSVSGFSEILRELCFARGRWGIFLGTTSCDPNQLKLAAPYLSEDQITELMLEEGLYLFFPSREDCYEAYDLTVGDDGPTRLNSYDGPARVYALVCDPGGELQNENT